MPVRYEFVAEFPSSSKAGKTYTVKRRSDTGQLTCGCPVWVFNRKGDRTCYHTLRVVAGEVAAVQNNSVAARTSEVPVEGRRKIRLL